MKSCPAGEVINDHKIWYSDKIYGYCAKCSDETDLGCWGDKVGAMATPKATRYISGRKTPYALTMLNNSGVATVNSNKFNKICPGNMVFNGVNVTTKNNKIKDIDFSCGNISKAFCDKNPDNTLCKEYKPVLVPLSANALSKVDVKCPAGSVLDKHKVYAGDKIGTVCLGCSDGTDLGCYGLPSIGSYNHTLGVTNSISAMRSPENEINAMYGVNGLLLGKGTDNSEKVNYVCPAGMVINGFSGNFGDNGLYNVDYHCSQLPANYCDKNPFDPLCTSLDTDHVLPDTTATNIGSRKLKCAAGHHINKITAEAHANGVNYMCLECSDDTSLGCYGYTKNDGTKKNKYGLFKQIETAKDNKGKLLKLMNTADIGGDNQLVSCPKGQYLSGADFDVFGDEINNINFKCGNVYPFLLPIDEYESLGNDSNLLYQDPVPSASSGTPSSTASSGTSSSTGTPVSDPIIINVPTPVVVEPVPLPVPEKTVEAAKTEPPAEVKQSRMLMWIIILILIILVASYNMNMATNKPNYNSNT